MQNRDIQRYEEQIFKFMKGVDNSIGLRGNQSFTSILSDMSNNIERYTNKSLKQKLDLTFNRALLYCRRAKKSNQSKENWLRQYGGQIYDVFYTYASLLTNVYSIEDDTVVNELCNIKDYTGINKIPERFFLIEHKDILYLVEVTIKPRQIYFFISMPLQAPINSKYLSYSVSSEIDYVQTPEGKIDVTKEIKINNVTCSNTSCPRYKQCLYNSTNTQGITTKPVMCDEVRDSTCPYLEEIGILPAKTIIELALGLGIALQTRVYQRYIRQPVHPEYEHLPVPESDKDVIIHLHDTLACTKAKEELLRRLEFKPEAKPISKIPRSHASPREHERRGGNRRGYVRKDNIKVRPTTFRSTTVNKGHTPCTYKVKE